MTSKVTIQKRCTYCGAEIEVSMNEGSTEKSLSPVITAFNKVHRRKCEYPRVGMRTEVTVEK